MRGASAELPNRVDFHAAGRAGNRMLVAMRLRRGGIAKIARAAHTAGDAGERACAPARGSRAADRDGTCADCPADSLRGSGAHRRLAGAVRRRITAAPPLVHAGGGRAGRSAAPAAGADDPAFADSARAAASGAAQSPDVLRHGHEGGALPVRNAEREAGAFPTLRKRAARFIRERRSAGAALFEGGQRFLLQPRWGAVSAASGAG